MNAGAATARHGRIALRPLTPAAARAFAGRSQAVDGLALAPDPWTVAGTVCIGRIDRPDDVADALEATRRGADVLADVDPSMRDLLLDEMWRAGLEPWVAVEEPVPEWGLLLDELAGGASIAEAARRCHMSQRSAFRRLEQARVALGTPTTTGAVALWIARKQDNASRHPIGRAILHATA